MLSHLISNPQFGNPHQLLALTQNAQTQRNTHAYSLLRACAHSQDCKTPSNFRSQREQDRLRMRRRLFPSKGFGRQQDSGLPETAPPPRAGRWLSTRNLPFLHSTRKPADVTSLVATCLPPSPWDSAHAHLRIAQ